MHATCANSTPVQACRRLAGSNSSSSRRTGAPCLSLPGLAPRARRSPSWNCTAQSQLQSTKHSDIPVLLKTTGDPLDTGTWPWPGTLNARIRGFRLAKGQLIPFVISHGPIRRCILLDLAKHFPMSSHQVERSRPACVKCPRPSELFSNGFACTYMYTLYVDEHVCLPSCITAVAALLV